jgi:hypothetical protein
MTEQSFDDFYKSACSKFGDDKFTILPIQVTDENLENFNIGEEFPITKDDLESYRAVWLLKPICPKCSSELNGLFGSFSWGIVHGVGKCSDCGTLFRLYHYIGHAKKPLTAFSLEGF